MTTIEAKYGPKYGVHETISLQNVPTWLKSLLKVFCEVPIDLSACLLLVNLKVS